MFLKKFKKMIFYMINFREEFSMAMFLVAFSDIFTFWEIVYWFFNIFKDPVDEWISK